MTLTPSISVFRHRAYLQYWIMRQLITAARQMQAVAIGWQVYDIARQTRSIEESAFLLGLVGLAQFIPVLLFSLIGGQAADRFNRKTILVVTNIGRAIGALALATIVLFPESMSLPIIFSTAVFLGIIYAFSPAAASSLYPLLVPRSELRQAIAWNSLGFQGAAIVGPAVGGLLYIMGPQAVYITSFFLSFIAVFVISTARTPEHKPVLGAHGPTMVLEGLRYVRDNKIVLGSISLDLVVVLFGGATALLPIFARDILHVGAEGLGLLRTAPAAGALIIAFGLAMRPLTRRIGKWLLITVAIYGVGMLAFALSNVFIFSMIALAITGAADMISVYIRQSIIQLVTPENMRGRVSPVDFIFIAASNELGEFESGIAARFLGPVGAVILGGSVALAAALSWPKLFPLLTQTDRIDTMIAKQDVKEVNTP